MITVARIAAPHSAGSSSFGVTSPKSGAVLTFMRGDDADTQSDGSSKRKEKGAKPSAVTRGQA